MLVHSVYHDLIVKLHASPAHWALALTGGGASAAGKLLSVPGGSRTILEIVVPYHPRALAEYLGREPESYCSPATCQVLARRALERARWLAPGAAVYGLGCTASLISDRVKRGDHRVHVASAGGELVRTWSLTLSKGARDRFGEEGLVAHLILQAMAQTLGLPVPLPPTLALDEKIEESAVPLDPWWTCLAETGAVLVAADGQCRPETRWNASEARVLVPGAFNPLHAAHLALADAAQRLTGKPAAFELSVTNVDKPELAAEEVRGRLAQFAGQAAVWLTRAPRFVDKAELFSGATFAVGADTAERLVAPRYYENDGERLNQAFELVQRCNCHFLVASRVDAAGHCLTLEDIAIPSEFRDLFRAIPPEDFRMDVSSTLLRTRETSV
jgi:hypothetical protein